MTVTLWGSAGAIVQVNSFIQRIPCGTGCSTLQALVELREIMVMKICSEG